MRLLTAILGSLGGKKAIGRLLWLSQVGDGEVNGLRTDMAVRRSVGGRQQKRHAQACRSPAEKWLRATPMVTGEGCGYLQPISRSTMVMTGTPAGPPPNFCIVFQQDSYIELL